MPNVHQVRVYHLWMLLSKMEGVRGEKLSFGDFGRVFFGLDFFNVNTLIERQQNNNLVKTYFLLEIAFNRIVLTRHVTEIQKIMSLSIFISP